MKKTINREMINKIESALYDFGLDDINEDTTVIINKNKTVSIEDTQFNTFINSIGCTTAAHLIDYSDRGLLRVDKNRLTDFVNNLIHDN